jgi:hypothetical protein
LVVLAVLAGALALHAFYYFPFVSDEALVTLRYAARLGSGQGPTWSDGERIEGYTNFLWVVLHGLAGSLSLGLVPAARALGLAGMFLCLGCVGLEPRKDGTSLPRLVAGGTLLVATAPLAIGAIGGLEQGLLAGLLALALRLLERSAFETPKQPRWLLGLPLALIALLRTDGVFIVLALLGGAACLPRPSASSLRRALLLSIPTAFAVVAELAFRVGYYGDWLPASVRALTSERTFAGLEHAGRGVASASMLVLLALVATGFALRRGDRWGLVLPWAVALSSVAGAGLVGGSMVPGFREIVPALVAWCFLVADEVAAQWSRIRSQRMLVLPILGLCEFLHATQGADTAENRRAKKDLRERTDLAVGRALKTAFGARGRPLLAVERPGALPFGSELPSIDFTGANTPSLGDSASTRRRSPDLVAFAEPGKPATHFGARLFHSKDFADGYQAIQIAGPEDTTSELWIRRERGSLGVVRTADRIELPGYLFTSQASRATSALDASGVLVAELNAKAPGVVPELMVPAGRWRIDVGPPTAELVADLRCQAFSMGRTAGGTERVFEIDRPTRVDVVLAPRAGARGITLRSTVLTRVSDAPTFAGCPPSGSPARLPVEQLSNRMLGNSYWAHPKNFMFGRNGAVVELGSRASLSGLELSLSRNDAYLVELRRNGELVWSTNVKREGGGRRLANLRFDLPKPVEGGTFELFVQPRKGDEPCSLGHLAIR